MYLSMSKTKQENQSLTNLLSNPIVMGIGAIAMIPDLIPVLIGGFVGFVISKNRKEQDGKENKQS